MIFDEIILLSIVLVSDMLVRTVRVDNVVGLLEDDLTWPMKRVGFIHQEDISQCRCRKGYRQILTGELP